MERSVCGENLIQIREKVNSYLTDNTGRLDSNAFFADGQQRYYEPVSFKNVNISQTSNR